jgi:dynein heavy chain
MATAMVESDCSIPLFFVLFPGVEPTTDIRNVCEKYNKSISNNTLIEISMGQGQEERANKALVQAAQDGNWVALNNIHLMTTWTRVLELKLDEVTPTAHEEFRCFLSSEAPPLPWMQIIPESILQNALKVSNEAPQDVKSNMTRAYSLFSQARIDECAKKVEYKAILFGLCTFHSFILARKKFGSQGWSRMYSFNDGDLTICGDILRNYLNRYEVVPWDDLRYLFGEIMYGGHITDAWDRRTNNAYLRVLIKPELLERYLISPNFTAPDANKSE